MKRRLKLSTDGAQDGLLTCAASEASDNLRTDGARAMSVERCNHKGPLYNINPNYDRSHFDRHFHRWMQACSENDSERMGEESNQIYRFLEHFVYDSLWRCCPEAMKRREFREELIQNAWAEIMRVLPRYNPDKAGITTYLDLYVKHQGYVYCCEDLRGASAHYADKFEQIRMAADRLEEQGQRVTEVQLSLDTGMPLREIQKYLTLEKRSRVHSLEELQEQREIQLPESPDSPEEAAMRGDLHRAFLCFLEKGKLNSEERLLLQLLWDSTADGRKGANRRELAVMMQMEAAKMPKLCGRKYYPEKIARILGSIRRKMKRDETICDYLMR